MNRGLEEHRRRIIERRAELSIIGRYMLDGTRFSVQGNPFGQQKMRRVASAVALVFGTTILEMKSRERAHKVVLARQAAMQLMRLEIEPMPALNSIAKFFDRDHTSILWGLRQCRKRTEDDEHYAAKIEMSRRVLAIIISEFGEQKRLAWASQVQQGWQAED